jgi:ribosomal protein L40E
MVGETGSSVAENDATAGSGRCSFCAHVNPPAAKFCNDCGSALRLRPCARCEAINDVDAARCHQCGQPLDGSASTDAPPEAPGGVTESSIVKAIGADDTLDGRAGVPPSAQDLAVAAERLEAFWRESLHAAAATSTSAAEPAAAQSADARAVVAADPRTPVIVRPQPTISSGWRTLIAIGLLALVGGVAYAGFRFVADGALYAALTDRGAALTDRGATAPEIRRRQVDAGHLRAALFHRLGEDAAAATDIGYPLAREAARGVVDPVQAQRIDVVQRLEFAVRIPPSMRERRKFGELGRIGVRARDGSGRR